MISGKIGCDSKLNILTYIYKNYTGDMYNFKDGKSGIIILDRYDRLIKKFPEDLRIAGVGLNPFFIRTKFSID